MSAATEDNVFRTDRLIRKDRHILTNNIAAIVDLSHGTAHAIVHKSLSFGKVSARWVPKMLDR